MSNFKKLNLSMIRDNQPTFIQTKIVLSISVAMLSFSIAPSHACQYMITVDGIQKCVGYIPSTKLVNELASANTSNKSLMNAEPLFDVAFNSDSTIRKNDFYEPTDNLEILTSFYENNTVNHTITYSSDTTQNIINAEATTDIINEQEVVPNPISVLNLEVLKDFYNGGDLYTNETIDVEKSAPEVSVINDENSHDTSNFNILQRIVEFFTPKKNSEFLEDSTKNAKQNLSLGVISKNGHSTLSEKYDLDRNSQVGIWKPRSHNSTYLLPFFSHSRPNLTPETPTQDEFNYSENEYQDSETKFQFSLKSKVIEDLFSTKADLWFGYTQQSHWQIYNIDNSRPFRSTNYMPEIFITHPVTKSLPFDGQLRMLGTGFMHHSNGEVDPLSRSWNRLYAIAGAEWGKLTVMPRVWVRIKPNEKIEAEDNPDITDFYGYGDLKLYYDLETGPSIASTLRYNPITNRGSAEIDYIVPLENNINVYVNFFHGYGESIVDYNHKDTTVGLGVMLTDWKGL